MSKIPNKIRKGLSEEARKWDSSIAGEKPQRVAALMEKAESFKVSRPARQPVSVRIDPLDLSMLKRIARRKGVPFTQLMSMWVHEKVVQEQGQAGS